MIDTHWLNLPVARNLPCRLQSYCHYVSGVSRSIIRYPATWIPRHESVSWVASWVCPFSELHNLKLTCCLAFTIAMADFFDENLRWNHHIDKLVTRISSTMGILRSLRNIVPIDTLKLMYNVIVLPTSIMLMLCMMQALRPIHLALQRLQIWAAQLMSGTSPRDSRNPMFKELGRLSLENRRLMHKCTMVFKCRNGLAPPYFHFFSWMIQSLRLKMLALKCMQMIQPYAQQQSVWMARPPKIVLY